MKRYLSVWLPRWQIERRSGYLALRQGNGLPLNGRHPLVLSTMAQSGARITATNPAAEAQGLSTGMSVADARAICPSLVVEPADEDGDDRALRQLVLWCQRYSPFTRADAPDGVCIDITGCAHLFGGEAAMAEDLADRLHGFGLTARIAISPAIGAGWAVARYGADAITIVPEGRTSDHIAPLPVAGLRVDADTLSALARVGLKQIGMLVGKPRAPLATRFGRMLVLRLDQALGLEDETLDPLSSPPQYRSECRFAEPIVTLDAVEIAVRRLTRDLAGTLFKAGKAARRLELALFRVDGWHEALQLRTSGLTRDADHLARLLCERLERIQDHAGFGFEAATLGAFDVEDAAALQQEMEETHGPGMHEAGSYEDDLPQLLDRLVNRFGAGNVTRFVPQASYVPERASRAVSVLEVEEHQHWVAQNLAEQDPALLGKPPFARTFDRPLLLFSRPEPVSVIVEMPDKPPARFEWRRISHRVTRADGPERIAPEWWVQKLSMGGDPHIQTRDYYRVEDETGLRFWLYRDGLYERPGDEPRWFIHGLFP